MVAAAVSTVMVAVLCTAERPHMTRNGWREDCGWPVIRVPADARWEDVLNVPVEVPCKACGKRYLLSDFLRV